MIGKTLGHYQITEKLGNNWNGEVYRAEDRRISRQLVFEIVPPEFAQDAEWSDHSGRKLSTLLRRELQRR